MFDDTQVDQQEVAQESVETPVETKPQETEQARNFRQLKEQKDKSERERERLERELDKAVRYIQDQQSQRPVQAQQHEDDDLPLKDDDLAEGKYIKKLHKELKELKTEIKKNQQYSQESLAETRLKTIHPDADKVLCRANIDVLNERYPEIAATISNSSADMYGKMLSAYTLIKQFGIHSDDSYDADKQVIQRNAAKPRPVTSLSPQQGESPLTKANAFANGLTDDLKKQLWRETQEAMKLK